MPVTELDVLSSLQITFLKKKKKKSLKIFHIFNSFQRDLGFYRCRHHRNATLKSVKDFVSGGLHGTDSECFRNRQVFIRAGTKSQRGCRKVPWKVCDSVVIKAKRWKDGAWYQLRFQLASGGLRKLGGIQSLKHHGEKKNLSMQTRTIFIRWSLHR